MVKWDEQRRLYTPRHRAPRPSRMWGVPAGVVVATAGLLAGFIAAMVTGVVIMAVSEGR